MYVCHIHKFTFKWEIPKVSELWKAVLSYCGGLHLENLLLIFLATSKWVLNWQIWPCVKNSGVIKFLISKIMSVLCLCSLCESVLSQDTEGMPVLCKLWLRKQMCMFEGLGTAWHSLSILCAGSNSGWAPQLHPKASRFTISMWEWAYTHGVNA